MSSAAFIELGAVPSRERVFSKAVAIAWKLEFSLAMEPNEARMLERVSFAKRESFNLRIESYATQRQTLCG